MVNKICIKLDISPSSIQTQVKKNFIKRYKIPGFESLVKSADLLKKMLIKFGVLESKKQHGIKVPLI